MKKSITLRGLSILIFSCVLIFLSNCKKESDTIKISKAKISGYVQKGPFVNGTTIQMYELNSSLDQTGNVFNTQITNNKGSFEINDVNLSSQYVQFSANGYYYNEILGEVSISPLTLNALADISDISTVNVNILTHLEKSRVEYLLDHGKDFTEAKRIAQTEVLDIFGYKLDDMNPSEMLDISIDEEQNAILIAVSLILQGNRSVGDLTELLANINTDIRQDGQLNDNNILNSLLNSASELDISTVRSNLQNRYKELEQSVTIPGFEKYINDFLEENRSKPSITDFAVINIGAKRAELTATVNANGLNTEVSFEYGPYTGYGQEIGASPYPVTGSINTSVSAYLDGLDIETLYHCRIKAKNILGTSYSEDFTFTTLEAPSVETGNSVYPRNDGANVTGNVNSQGQPVIVTFEYGMTTEYGYETEPLPPFISGIIFENVLLSCRISGLAPESEYHYRIKLLDTDTYEPIFGEDRSFTTLNTITDTDGNVYETLMIGTQIWMAQNLKTSKYNNGDPIETTIPDTLDITDQTVGYQWAYDGDESNVDTYGRLYTWFAATDSRGVCPTGWHIPSDQEWIDVANLLGGDTLAGGKLKETGTIHWIEYNTGATNETGFTALPGGYRISKFASRGEFGIWWSSSEISASNAAFRRIYRWSGSLFGEGITNAGKWIGMSVRCIKDN